MGHPVTTNPFIIMLINMTVVFIVLISLSALIQLIHKIDPTKQPEVSESGNEGGGEMTEAAETMAIVSKLKAANAEPKIEEGIPPEIIAVIMAAIAGYGYSAGHVRAVRMINHDNTGWHSNGLQNGLTQI